MNAKEKPILFSGPMVRAILDGSKTQTRRTVKHIPVLGDPLAWCAAARSEEPGFLSIVGDWRRFCPYGEVGTRLWVRETWQAWRQCSIEYDEWEIAEKVELVEMGPSLTIEYRATSNSNGPWRPSIHMPRWASRITLEITKVRVERVQDITEEDAKCEGVQFLREVPDADETLPARTLFEVLWDSINAKKHSWGSNPWVWIIDFKRITP